MRGTCSWSALLLQISETSTLHWLQSAQVSWLGLCKPETSPWSAGTSLLASIECHADDGQTLFHPFSLVGCQGCCKLSFLPCRADYPCAWLPKEPTPTTTEDDALADKRLILGIHKPGHAQEVVKSTLGSAGAEKQRGRTTFITYTQRESERELNSVNAANRADETLWTVHVVSSILSRSCNKYEATSFWRGCHIRRRMAP